MGYEARFVNDWTDHVWTEVYLDGRWQHADSCECTLDAPMVCFLCTYDNSPSLDV